jgi:hypothetical protein
MKSISDKPAPVMVWFGEFEIGNFYVGEGFAHPMYIIHAIHERRHMLESDIEEYVKANNHTGDYIIPENINDDIVYSQTYMKGH